MWKLLALLLVLLAAAALIHFRSQPETAEVPPTVPTRAAHSSDTSSDLAGEVPPAPAPRDALADSPTAEVETAVLVVHVRRKTTHAPVANARVRVLSGKPTSDFNSSTLAIAEVLGEGRTDLAGEVSLRLRAGEPLMVEAEVPQRPTRTELQHLHAGIAAGARAEIEILLPDEDDARVFGQVVAAESGEPIAGARVELRDSSGAADRGRPAFMTADDGRFELVFTGWTRPHLCIAAEGRGARLADPAGHDDPARPLLVRLALSGTLEIRARDAADTPLAGVRLRVAAWSVALDIATSEGVGFFMRDSFFAPEETWMAETGPDGRATIMGLPAEVELRPAVLAQEGRTQLELERIVLLAGELRQVDVRLGGRTRIVGIALDEEAQPIPRLAIYLAPSKRDAGLRTLVLEDLQPRGQARTDGDGRFAFDPVEPGAWLVAPARNNGPGEAGIAGMPVRVVTAGEPEVAVTLRACRGLFISGVVLDPEGQAVADSRVEAYAEQQMFWGDTRSGADGSFRLGPVTADAFTLLAYGRTGYSGSDPVTARAGDTGLVLRLQHGGTLRGRVLDGASGAACAAQLMFTPEQRGFGPFGSGGMMSTEADGTFELRNLKAGRYGLSAMSADGRFALQTGIEVAARGEVNGVVLTLVPGGRLALHYTGAQPQLFVSVTRGGAPVHFGEVLAPDGRVSLLAPAGDVVLELRSDPLGAPRRLPLRVNAGETQALEFGD